MATSNIKLVGLRQDIVMQQGKSIEIEYTLTNADGSALDGAGYILRGQVRKDYSSSTPAINMTLANQRLIWVDQSTFRFKMKLEPAATTGLFFDKDSPDIWAGVYDIEVDSGNTFPGVQSPWWGSFTIMREVTR